MGDMAIKKDKSRLPMNIYLLGLVSFFADFSSEIYFAILPFFILELGGTSVAIGIIAGVADGFLSFLKAFFGFISDKFDQGRKKFLLWGYGLPALFKFLMAFSKSWPVLLILRTLERVGKGIRSAPRDAMIVESIADQPEIVGRAFGLHRAMDSLGAVLGSVTALLLISIGLSYSNTLFISAFIGFVVLIPIYLVKETQIQPQLRYTKGKSPLYFSEFIKSGGTPLYWRMLLITSLHGLSLISYMFFVINTENYNFSNVPLLSDLDLIQRGIIFYIYFNIIYTIISYFAGILADSYSRILVLQIGFFAYFVSLLVFIVSGGFISLVFAFTLFGIGYGFNEGNIRAIFADQIEEKYRATAYGIFHGVLGLSLFFGNIIAGVLYKVESQLSFLFAGVFSFFALGLLTYISKK
jgi:MFS family permease